MPIRNMVPVAFNSKVMHIVRRQSVC